MRRQERNQMFCNADRTNTWATATVRIANVLWRFRWQTSAPIVPGLVSPTCAFLGTVHLYTCAKPHAWMISHFFDVDFEDTIMCWKDKWSWLLPGLFSSALARSLQIDISVFVAFNSNGCIATLDCACQDLYRVRKPEGGRYFYVLVRYTFQVSTDHTQTSIFAGSTWVRLQGSSLKSGDPLAQIVKDFQSTLVAFHLFFRSIRVENILEFGTAQATYLRLNSASWYMNPGRSSTVPVIRLYVPSR